MALAGSHPFRNSSKRKASKTWPSQTFVWLGLNRVRNACEAVVCTVCSELALAALKEFSFGMTMFTAWLRALARLSLSAATLNVPPPMLAVASRMLEARGSIWLCRLNAMVWTVSACFPLMRVSARRSWLCSQEATRGRSAALLVPSLSAIGWMHLHGETTLHAAVPHGVQGQVLQVDVSAFEAGQNAQLAFPQLPVAL